MRAVFDHLCEDLSSHVGEGDFDCLFFGVGVVVFGGFIGAEGFRDEGGEFGYFDWYVEGVAFFAHLNLLC